MKSNARCTGNWGASPFAALAAFTVLLSSAGVGFCSLELVGSYSFDGNALDSSGYHRDGVVRGSVTATTDRFGNPGGALYFDGSSGIGVDIAGLELAGKSFAISFWVKTENQTPAVIMFQSSSAPNNLPQEPAGSSFLHIAYRSGTYGGDQGNTEGMVFGFYYNDLDTSPTLSADRNSWHNYYMSYDASTGSRSIFRDGFQAVSDTASPYLGGGIFTVGAGNWDSSWFQGSLDDLQIWAGTPVPESTTLWAGGACALVLTLTSSAWRRRIRIPV